MDKIPYGESTWMTPLTRGYISTKQKWVLKKEKLADELRTGAKMTFLRRRVVFNGIDEIWCADLVVMQPFSWFIPEMIFSIAYFQISKK